MAIIEYLNVVLGLDHGKFDQDVKQASVSVAGVGKAIAASAAGAGTIKLGFDSVKLAAEAETAEVSFEVLLGSAEKAKKAIEDFRQIDRETPLSFIDIQRAAKTMLAFGVEADDLGKRLRQLAAISMGNEDRFQSLALAFGQTTSAGRLMGQEVLQFVNAGFSPLQQLSKSTGISMRDLKKAMEEGSISIDMVEKAFDQATEKGGLFYGMNEKIAQTTAGQFAKLSGDLKMLGIEVGEQLVPALKDMVDLLREGTSLAKDTGFTSLISAFASGSQLGVAAAKDIVTGKTDAMDSLAGKFIDADVEAINKRFAIQNRITESRKEEQKISDEQIRNELTAAKKMQELSAKENLQKEIELDFEKEIERIKKKHEEIEKEAKDIQRTLDPRMVVQEQIDRARELEKLGALSSEDLLKFAEKLAMDFAESQVNRPQETPFAAKGSVEAYRLLMQRDADREEEKQLQRDANTFLADIKKELANRPPIAVLRR